MSQVQILSARPSIPRVSELALCDSAHEVADVTHRHWRLPAGLEREPQARATLLSALTIVTQCGAKYPEMSPSRLTLPELLYRSMYPPAPTGTMARLGTAPALFTFRFDTAGRALPAG
jgi:hypothetical protein